ncbi:hypothetical protein V1478_018854 [Vespula squamosa]|uniref:Uncharacterized protein n=1 Tax=Vespula squamosa TaxID=30214 RepID=A0ABD1ZU00_VESSQ
MIRYKAYRNDAKIFYIPFKFSPANAPLHKHLTTGTPGKYSNIINSKLSISELQYSETNMNIIECFFNSTISLIFLSLSSMSLLLSFISSKDTVQIRILVPLIKIATHSAMFLHTQASITVFNCSALFKELSNKVFNSSQYIPIVQGCILNVNVDIRTFGILGKHIATKFSFSSEELSVSNDTV